MNICYENLLNPREAIESVKEQLFHLYQQDYGKRMRGIIEERWNNTIFIFESTPKDNYQFVQEHKDKIQDKKFIKRTKAEYKDYIKKDQLTDSIIRNEYKKYVEMRFHIFSEEQIDELWNKESKELDKEKYGCTVIESCMVTKRDLIKSKKKALMATTIWGKRMQKQYPTIDLEILVALLLDRFFPSATCKILDKDNQIVTVCFIPLISYRYLSSLDRMVLHELRHVVETDGVRIGLTIFPNKEFYMLNEIRTENNAIKDENRMPLIFGRNSNKLQSFYEELLERFSEIEPYEDLLNIVSFTGKINEERSLIESLDQKLKEVEQNLKKQKQIKNM